MKNRIMLLILVGIIFTITGYAQKIIKSAHGAIIEATGIPHTKTKKARETDGTNTVEGSNTATNIGSYVSDELVYYKFEVYGTDSDKVDWLSAINLCKDLSVDGGGWRLPTRRELVLIWLLRAELEVLGGLTLSDAYYMSATEFRTRGEPNRHYWRVNFDYLRGNYRNVTVLEYTGKQQWGSTSLIRCIRDL